MLHTDLPAFALVGHPNKGKSSIVSTLAYDDSVRISSVPGETIKTQEFPLKVDGEVQYRLFDTPGFQVPRRVLEWLKEHESTSSKHPEVIQAFVEEHKSNSAFNDEVELLTPIIEGACIVYVVDGSKPYSEEYESEMEILRWSGRPSIALINTINDDDYTLEWENALNQHFKMVRLYNPMQATFKEKIALLETLSHLNAHWTTSLKNSIETLKLFQQQRMNETARLITETIYQSIIYTLSSSLFKKSISQEDKVHYSQDYLEHLVNLEYKEQKSIEKLWGHFHLSTHNSHQDFHVMELFSQESQKVFGLSKSSLILVSAVAGAIAGGSAGIMFAPIDGGISSFVTASFGAVTATLGSLAGYGKYLNIVTLGGRFEQKQLKIGPMKDTNFPFILLARSLFHAIQITQRSHAARDEINLDGYFADTLLDSSQKKTFASLHRQFQKGSNVTEAKGDYQKMLIELLHTKIS